jgi:hypothetical protein
LSSSSAVAWSVRRMFRYVGKVAFPAHRRWPPSAGAGSAAGVCGDRPKLGPSLTITALSTTFINSRGSGQCISEALTICSGSFSGSCRGSRRTCHVVFHEAVCLLLCLRGMDIGKTLSL